MKYYFRAFKNYARCDGRSTRKEFWWFILFHNIVVFALSFLDGILGFYSTDIPLNYGYMTLIYLIATICPSICLQVRRLHDVGKSGSWWLVGNIPILNFYLLYLYLKPSEACVNYYGYPSNYIPTTVCNEDKPMHNSNQVRFCRKCGYELIAGSDFCSQCGTQIIENVEGETK